MERHGIVMNREDFLRQFREALDGKVSEGIIQDNENYYRSYINGQIRSGKTEEEVLRSLGEPRLLAKTIEEINKFASESTEERRTYADDNVGYDSAQGGRYHSRTGKTKHVKLPGWLIAGIVIVVAVVLLTVAFRVFLFFAPAILIFLLVGFVYRCVRDWFREY